MSPVCQRFDLDYLKYQTLLTPMVSLRTSYAVKLKTQAGIFLEPNWKQGRWSTFALTGRPRTCTMHSRTKETVG